MACHSVLCDFVDLRLSAHGKARDRAARHGAGGAIQSLLLNQPKAVHFGIELRRIGGIDATEQLLRVCGTIMKCQALGHFV